MSAEATLPKEDTVDTNPVEKDLSRFPPAGTTNPVTADTSLLTSPTSFTSAHETLPSGEVSDCNQGARNGLASENGMSTGTVDTPTASQLEERSRPGVPVRTSSNSQAQTSTSAPPQSTAAQEPKTISRKTSQDSIKEKRRSTSIGSRHSRKEKVVEKSGSGLETRGSQLDASSSAEKSKKRAVPRFLSLLGCCGAPKDEKDRENSEPAVAPKKARVLQSNRNRQPTPVAKQDKTTASSSTGELKEKAEETIGGTPYSEQTAAAKPKMITRRSKEGPPAEKPSITGNGQPSEKDPVTQTAAREQPLPPLPNSNAANLANPPQQTDHPPAPDIVPVLPPDHPQTTEEEEIAPEEEQTINDRTPEQAKTDTDLEMTQAPPIAPIPEDGSWSNEPEKDQKSAQMPLPPPPPRNNQERSPAADRTRASSERQQWLLPPIQPSFRGKKCLVLDLDETLVHSSFKILHQADFTIPVEIEGQWHNVYVIKRPGVDQFMKRVGELYEVVVFTASVSKYGDPLLDQLDIHKVVHHRLFRESCYNHAGNYVKDLSQVGRDLRETIIIDNSPTSYIFHPQHAVPISSWFSDAHDNELLDLIPVLEDLAGSQVRDVSLVLDVAL